MDTEGSVYLKVWKWKWSISVSFSMVNQKPSYIHQTLICLLDSPSSLYLCLSFFLCSSVSVCLSVCLFISICLSVCLSVCLSSEWCLCVFVCARMCTCIPDKPDWQTGTYRPHPSCTKSLLRHPCQLLKGQVSQAWHTSHSPTGQQVPKQFFVFQQE